MEIDVGFMKKGLRHHIFGFIVLTIIAGCSGNLDSGETSSKKLNVVATTTIIADVIENVSGEKVNITTLLPSGSDPHRFDPSPREARAISEAEIIFMNGAGLDNFVLDLVPNSESAPVVINLSDGLQLIRLDPDDDVHSEHEGSEGSDPHVWMDPENVAIWTSRIAEALAQVDPENAQVFEMNAAAYIAALSELNNQIQSEVDDIPSESRLLVTDHDSLAYFADKYGFTIVGFVVPGYSTLAQPSAQELARLIDQIKASEVPVIFVDPSFNASLAEAVAADAGVAVVAVYTASLSDTDGPASTYIDLMSSLTAAIRENLVDK